MVQEHLKQILSEHDNKIAEFDVHLRKKEERCAILENELRQRVQGKRFFFFLTVVQKPKNTFIRHTLNRHVCAM